MCSRPPICTSSTGWADCRGNGLPMTPNSVWRWSCGRCGRGRPAWRWTASQNRLPGLPPRTCACRRLRLLPTRWRGARWWPVPAPDRCVHWCWPTPTTVRCCTCTSTFARNTSSGRCSTTAPHAPPRSTRMRCGRPCIALSANLAPRMRMVPQMMSRRSTHGNDWPVSSRRAAGSPSWPVVREPAKPSPSQGFSRPSNISPSIVCG